MPLTNERCRFERKLPKFLARFYQRRQKFAYKLLLSSFIQQQKKLTSRWWNVAFWTYTTKINFFWPAWSFFRVETVSTCYLAWWWCIILDNINCAVPTSVRRLRLHRQVCESSGSFLRERAVRIGQVSTSRRDMSSNAKEWINSLGRQDGCTAGKFHLLLLTHI